MTVLDLAVQTLHAELRESYLETITFRDQITAVIAPESILPAARLLKTSKNLDFNLLAALTAVDYWPENPRFSIVYQFYSMANKAMLGIRVPLPAEKPELDSIDSIYPNANGHEREVFDMFGITFSGSRDLRRILMPWDWEGHPLRKDYPLGEEEIQFSFNFDEINLRKHYARD